MTRPPSRAEDSPDGADNARDEKSWPVMSRAPDRGRKYPEIAQRIADKMDQEEALKNVAEDGGAGANKAGFVPGESASGQPAPARVTPADIARVWREKFESGEYPDSNDAIREADRARRASQTAAIYAGPIVEDDGKMANDPDIFAASIARDPETQRRWLASRLRPDLSPYQADSTAGVRDGRVFYLDAAENAYYAMPRDTEGKWELGQTAAAAALGMQMPYSAFVAPGALELARQMAAHSLLDETVPLAQRREWLESTAKNALIDSGTEQMLHYLWRRWKGR